ncbi:MAG: WecB/TagA/CpsF family glycosyltransferase, partial [Waterburya sp.]
MATKNNNLPIGKLLHNAGLISEKQLENALNIQAKYTKMKLGEILVLQEGLKPKTIDFFVNRWSKINIEGRQFPIGYYLKNADLLKEEQIQTILTEQK